MSTTTTAHFSFEVEDTTGNTAYKIRYRLAGETIWNQVLQSGTTVDISGLAINRMYDFQVVNINGDDNPASIVFQSINITDPDPAFFTTNTQITAEFPNLSDDIDTYTLTIAPYSTPGIILETAILAAASTVEHTFTGLDPATIYVVTITPAANQFTTTFSYQVTTELTATCPAPQNATATLV